MEAFPGSILQTLSYFDIFDYPLTREELFYFLWQPPENLNYTDFVFSLEKEMTGLLNHRVERSGGYYFLKGRGGIVAKRERKVFYTEEKMKIAKQAAKKLRYIPFVKALFVCNQLPVGVKASSDIDVFIITRSRRIWLVRFLTTFILTLFRLRPTSMGLHFLLYREEKSMTDKICLSFYVTEDTLNLHSICVVEPDIYQAYWISQLIPMYDPLNFYDQIQEKNDWIKTYIPQACTAYTILKRWKVQDSWISLCIRKTFEWFGSGIIGYITEKQIRFLQLQKMKFGGGKLPSAQDKRVVVSDTMLKFHENDRKAYFKEEWEKRWKEKFAL